MLVLLLSRFCLKLRLNHTLIHKRDFSCSSFMMMMDIYVYMVIDARIPPTTVSPSVYCLKLS